MDDKVAMSIEESVCDREKLTVASIKSLQPLDDVEMTSTINTYYCFVYCILSKSMFHYLKKSFVQLDET